MRKVNDVLHNYTDIERKVRKATSGKPYGAAGTVLAEIADATYDPVQFPQIMSMIWKRLNEPGKYWRHVYKALVLLEYVIKVGSEQVIAASQQNIFAIQTLKDFQHIDEADKDQGQNVREKSKKLVALLKDPERLREERTAALQAQKRFRQGRSGGSGGYPSQQQPSGVYAPGAAYGGGGGGSRQRPAETGAMDERQLQLALEMSKVDAEEDARRRTEREENDPDLQAALALSKVDAMVSGPPSVASGSRTDALLDFGDDSSSQFDPFASSRPPQQQQSNPYGGSDPFGGAFGAPAAPQQQRDPFGGAGMGGDPFGASSAVHQPAPPAQSGGWGADPFGSSQPAQRPPATQSDPFGSAFGAPAPAAASPWGASPAAAAPKADFHRRLSGDAGNGSPFGAAPAPKAADPWGSPSKPTPAPAPASDPWGAPSAVPKAPAASDPWGAPVTAPTPAADPWGAPAAPAAPFASPGRKAPAGAPGGAMAELGNIAKNSNKIDEFASLANRKPSLATGASSGSVDPWDMKGLDSNLPGAPLQPTAEQKVKKPNILEKHKDLVNLDALAPTSKPMTGSTPQNPFALGGGMAAQPTAGRPSPFQGGSTGPMNQMRPMGMGAPAPMAGGMGMGGMGGGMGGMGGGMGGMPMGGGMGGMPMGGGMGGGVPMGGGMPMGGMGGNMGGGYGQPMGGMGGNMGMGGYGAPGYQQPPPMQQPMGGYGQPMNNMNPYGQQQQQQQQSFGSNPFG